MELKALFDQGPVRRIFNHPLVHPQKLLVMKLTMLLLTVAMLQVSAKGVSQTVTFTAKNAPIERAFTAIKKQTGYVVFYDYKLVEGLQPINVQAINLPLTSFLAEILKGRSLDFAIEGKTIIISRETAAKTTQQTVTAMAAPLPQTVNGTVTDDTGTPLPGVSITLKGTTNGTSTDAQGRFTLQAEPGQVLVISAVSFETQEVKVGTTNQLNIQLKPGSNSLDESVVIGYGTAIRRSNTGSVSTVRSRDIAAQPVTDPLAALQGRVPGFFVSSSNGLPGSSFKVMLRGVNSISGGNEPLYIIDGVPYFSEPLNEFTTANGNQSPLASINPADIDRIDVLKDADATAIYGSRGANGVILITTKKGKAGTTRFNFNAYSGGSQVVNKLKMLSTPEYIKMRKEAYANDGVAYNETNAPDLTVWDQNKTTDWVDYLMGGTSSVTDVQGSVSGGNAQTRFLLSGAFRRETTVYPNDLAWKRGGVHLNVDHTSLDGKFNIAASVNYSNTSDKTMASDLATMHNLAPNYPLYDANGKYYWFQNEQNPAAYELRRSHNRTNNLVASSNIRYTILKGLDAKLNLGYTNTTLDQLQVFPDATFNPVTTAGSMTYFGNASNRSYSVEPQVDYQLVIGQGKLSAMAGATWQEFLREGESLIGEKFPSDALLEDQKSAGSLRPRTSTYRFYRYNSFFGRLNYNWDETYILNATFRRDGSTRFGPGNRFGNFGAVGAAWVFTNEKFIPANNFLSFGKLRASYGTTGNDLIGDYAYLDTWSPVNFNYDGILGLNVTRQANDYYRWEENRKLEAGLELGFAKNRVLLNANFYRNISGNQLVDFPLSPQTGFSSYVTNLPAKVLNSGIEIDLTSTNIQNKDFRWKSSFNITFNKNELLEFPELETTGYKELYQVGKSLTIVRGYQSAGVDQQTGKAIFVDVDGNPSALSEYSDYVILGKTMPDFYGGFQNSISYKGFELDFLFQFVQQEGPSINYGYLSTAYGIIRNKDEKSGMKRWQKPGDLVPVPRATTTAGNVLYDQYRLSSAVWGDASYIRLKNVSLRYDLSKYVKRYKISNLSVYITGQNLLTITNYEGFDPETQGLVMPPLRTLTAGLQFSF
ncbi:TonB-dependent receptor [Paraflavitalea pollutisoli]|uniref:TonB-dependent receptor n=1 Tax=Paraflavitalea pollutisoli TaxID=3034143 RepID=UPI0023EB277A|nr:TonB-dependent receptor [Paraflavitalea sp. H1-2-19X]